jgi:hypothetical protein
MCKYSILIINIFWTGIVLSQPVVTVANFPKPGMQIEYFISNAINPVNTNNGESQVWDFSDHKFESVSTVRYLRSSEIEGTHHFPGSTIAFEAPIGSGDFTYLDISEKNYKYLGFIVNSCDVPVLAKYDDPWILYSLPLNFKDEFNDSFSSTSTVINNGDTVKTHFRSEYSYKVDGYGKLITPFKTFLNSLRVFTITHGVDSAIHSGSLDTTIVTKYSYEKIAWISSDDDGVFEQVSTFNFIDFFLQDVVKSTSINQALSKEGSIKLFPDPVSDFVNVEMSGMKSGPLTINIFDSFGKKIIEHYFFNTGMSFINRQILLQELSPGLYHVKVHSLTNEWRAKFIKL